MIADEDDGSDAGLFAFPDFENEVDAIVRPLDDFGHHLNVEAAVAVIDLDDARDVGLHHRLRQRAARFRLDFLLKLLVLELAVALEGEPVDDRRFDDGDNQAAAGLRNADVLEQAGGVERLQRGIDLGGIETLARRHFEIGTDRVGFDATITFDHDLGIGDCANAGADATTDDATPNKITPRSKPATTSPRLTRTHIVMR